MSNRTRKLSYFLVSPFFMPATTFAWQQLMNTKFCSRSTVQAAVRRKSCSWSNGSPIHQFTNSYLITARTKRPHRMRMFGSRAGVAGNPPGEIWIQNVQDVLTDIDFVRLRDNLGKIRDMMGYPTYDVNLYLVEDHLMQETNRDTRGIDKATDILSFPFHQYVEPGLLQEPEFDIPDYYTLGEMMIDVPYVIRRCQEDKEDGIDEDEEDERGVSGAMATIYDPEERINMLLVHGMLHLVGHDHEEEEDYEIMVSKEEEILGELGMLPEMRTSKS